MSVNSPIVAWLTVFVTICGAATILWKWLIGPHLHRWVTENVVEPLAKVEHMTNQNGSKNDPATLPDWMHKIDERLNAQDATADRRYAEEVQWRHDHRVWSDSTVDGLDKRISRLESK